jgi:hypothetical protein
LISAVRRGSPAPLPIQPTEAEDQSPMVGYSEGDATTSRSARYERDRRNRAAAIAIWSCKCRAYGLDFCVRYGNAAKGFIEVHHIRQAADTPLRKASERVASWLRQAMRGKGKSSRDEGGRTSVAPPCDTNSLTQELSRVDHV